ncbi:MAG: hypothetical protein NWR96_08880 [Crocinitomicaceae bacterium]|jgi:hypothetical protein|nr:hypothetical protein [Crocinitomicaceae bacterium]MDP4761735.1 hypothetical protein [Crocinitomicaceae bacterium]
MRTFLSLLTLGLFVLAVQSCGSPANADKKTELKTAIKDMEDSLTNIESDPMKAAKIPSLTNIELINRLLAYYHAFPEDTFSSECLFKVHMKYSDLEAYDLSVAYGDTLLQLFPKYVNRDYVLESIASTYDVLIKPRNAEKVKFYYSLLLNEKLDKAKRKDLENRLKYVDMPFEEYIQRLN